MSEIPTPEMAPAFDPKPVEAKWGAFWLENEIGKPRAPREGETPFVITIPPPNVTGVLHLGHALQHSIHDCLIRYHRMKGVPTLCVPGTDHAGIATQIKVEAKLREEEGVTRHDLGRDKFIERVYEWKDLYGATIIDQMKSLGCSYDWSRERFTMDEGYVRAVLTVFKNWFERGLIYRGYRLVNWSSGAQTTVSDLEIEYKEVTGSLTYIKYQVEGLDEFVTVATSRPETMLGDTAVAVHPEDPRYTHLHGKNVILPLQNRPIPLILDAAVDKEFGTGAVKITPAHDPNDYEMGTRHGLPMITVIGFDDKITAEGGAYAGLNKIDARKKVVADLKELGLIEKVEPLIHSVGHCARTGVVIEPLLSEQWFVAMKELARPVADAIRMGRVRYQPQRFGNTSLEWLDNIRDWCISRQLWWGHRIPIWYGPNGEVKCSLEPITEPGWTQDTDVLDTWFSSALWPFAVLGWPDELQREWYPTSVLITGRDITNLWVSRMIATSLDFVETAHGEPEIPFHEVFVHPTVQDVFGLRMSKSLGTGIDPMELIEIYGADATRYGLLQLATGAQDVRFIDAAESKLGEDAVRRFMRENRGKPLPLSWDDKDGKPTERYPQMQSARNFANKIWNAARFVLNQVDENTEAKIPDGQLEIEEQWILAGLSTTIAKVTVSLDSYAFSDAASEIYNFIWNDFCDWFLEISKPDIWNKNKKRVDLLVLILETCMRLLHPFMPFESEEIWEKLPKPNSTSATNLSSAKWPVEDGIGASEYLEASRSFEILQEIVRACRALKNEAGVPAKLKPSVILIPRSVRASSIGDEIKSNLRLRRNLCTLAGISEMDIHDLTVIRPRNALNSLLTHFEVWLPLEGLIDVEKERAKLEKQLETAKKEHAKVSAKLSNSAFVDKAPREVVEKEEAKRVEFASQIEKLSQRLAAL